METTEKLKCIISAPCCMGGTDFSKYEELINKTIEEGHKICIMSYFHGEVESFARYDIGACLNGEICGNFDKKTYKDGIYDAELDGFNKPLKAFLWTDEYKRPRGLIVCADNKKDMKFARVKYNSKTSFL